MSTLEFIELSDELTASFRQVQRFKVGDADEQTLDTLQLEKRFRWGVAREEHLALTHFNLTKKKKKKRQKVNRTTYEKI